MSADGAGGTKTLVFRTHCRLVHGIVAVGNFILFFEVEHGGILWHVGVRDVCGVRDLHTVPEVKNRPP